MSATDAAAGPGPAPPGPAPKKLINLLRGWPSPSLLGAELLRDAANEVLSDPELFVPALQYGPDPGHPGLRDELASLLAGFYGAHPADAARVCVSGGASQAAACVLQSFTDPAYTRAVWVVAPCYYLACPIFEDAGFRGRLRAVPEDDEGVDLAWLERGLREVDAAAADLPAAPVYKDPRPFRKAYRHVIYVVPTCANPSGKTMTLRRREGLVALARAHDALIISDDVYDFLTWPLHPSSPTSSPTPASPLATEAPVLPRPFDIDFALGPSPHDGAGGRRFGHALSNGSFSKLLGPGARTGWVEASPDLAHGLAQTGSTRSGGAASQLCAALVWRLLRGGRLAAHVRDRCRPALRRRHALLAGAAREHLGARGGLVRVAGSSLEGGAMYGGYFVWVRLADGLTGREVADRALRDENLVVPPGEMFEVRGDEAAVGFPDCVRLCFSWEDEEDLVEGVRRLGRVLDTLRREKKGGGPGGREPGAGAGGLDDFR